MKYGFPKAMMMNAALAATLVVGVSGAAMAAPMPATAGDVNRNDSALAERVRKELVMLPFYGLFDHMAFRVEGGKVTLLGQVTRPTLHSSAGNVVKRLEGVTEVVNQIEVLPLSPFDDGIRLRVARAIYGSTPLSRYGLGAQPSIRIIVKNGDVTLEGVVLNEGDRTIANLKANGVFGVFKVTNNLRAERS
jgi:hyperosmotically inducible periplasmic protein